MFSETIELRGHIIDSLILPKVLDQILTHGAEVAERENAQLASAPTDGVFPDQFYVMTNQQTFVRIDGREIEVRPTMMDTAIAVDRKGRAARAVKFFDVRKGDEIVIGHQGVRVVPVQRATSRTDIFQFINTIIDADEPKSAIIRELAEELRRARKAKGKIAVVAGPAIVRTGAGQHLVRLIEAGYVDRLFAGNAFAGYDVERALFGTSLGVNPDLAFARGGRENLIRAVNAIREAGGIASAVEKKILTTGIMHACV